MSCIRVYNIYGRQVKQVALKALKICTFCAVTETETCDGLGELKVTDFTTITSLSDNVS